MSDPDGLSVFDAAPGDAAVAPSPAADDAPERLAHPAQRALAFVVDGIGAFLVTSVVVLAGLSAGAPGSLLAIVVVPALAAALCIALTALAGVTPGKAVLGLRVVDAVTGLRPGWRAIPRGLVLAAPPALGDALTAILIRLPEDGPVDPAFAALGALTLVPVGVWTALLVATAVRPGHRGLQDLAGRTIVVRR